MNTFQRVAAAVNKAVIPMFGFPVVGPILGRSMTVITYTGRRSGATYRVPVAYRRGESGVVEVGVALPDKKSWWRNFTGDGGPVTILLDGHDEQGYARSVKGSSGGVGVRITLGDNPTG